MATWTSSSSRAIQWWTRSAPCRYLANRRTGKKKKVRIDPFRQKTALEYFDDDLQPGVLARKMRWEERYKREKTLTTHGSLRLREEPVRNGVKEKNAVYVVKHQDEAVPNLMYLENRDMYFMYDARPTTKNRVLIYPRRIIAYPEDVTAPNLPVVSKVIERICEASEFMSKKPAVKASSVAFHVQFGDQCNPTPYRVHVTTGAGSGKPITVNNICNMLIRRRRMSIDAHRCLRNYIRSYSKYYRFGTRFDLLPPYEPVPPPPS